MSEIKKGTKLNDKTIEALKKYNTNKIVSEETKKKMSESAKKRWSKKQL